MHNKSGTTIRYRITAIGEQKALFMSIGMMIGDIKIADDESGECIANVNGCVEVTQFPPS